MKAIVATAASGGKLSLADLEPPTARGRELVVRVYASSLNPHDWKYHQWFQRSLYRGLLPLPPLRLGHDFVGEVIETGRRVRHFGTGDRVFGMTARPGAFAECIAIDERMVAARPQGISDPEAASLPMVSLTALQALRMAGLREGMAVLVIGGSGGVGSVAVQIAKAQGARVTAVCGTDNVELVRSLGADRVIDYRGDDFHECGERFGIVFDTIGQASSRTCRKLLLDGACFITTATSARNALVTVQSRIVARLRPDAIRSGTLLALPRGRDMDTVRSLVELGALRAVVDRQYPLDAIDEAIAYSRTGRARGKIVLLPPQAR